MNILDLQGPDFLIVYGIFLGVALAAAFLLRWLFRKPLDAPTAEALDLGPYDVAYLARGETLVCQTAVAALVRRGILAVDQGGRTRHQKNAAEPNHPLEKRLVKSSEPAAGATLYTLRKDSEQHLKAIHERLANKGLVVAPEQQGIIALFSLLPIGMVLLLGLAKIMVGMARDRPVGILVMLCLVTVVFMVMLVYRRPLRSVRGDLALGVLKDRHAALELTAQRQSQGLTHDDCIVALSLFGLAALGVGFQQQLAPLWRSKAASAWGSSSCGTSCGASCGSSSGGGGGCGGGCGGGGCGGCGG